uniref:RNA-directed DNA polymerase n=1 Tax=Tanacetum cinerariifolium TaxID=118510 RepID=A0A699GVC9_TANCI|nr:hypothetical protein [Tanacetum cinerariifolium]
MATKGNGDPPVPDLQTMEELCQPSLNVWGGPISPVAIQATNFGLKNDMIQQIHNSCQFHRLSGDDANKHLDKFLHVTESIKVNGVTDDAHRLNEITNFRRRPDESLFEAWECYYLSIDRCPNHNMLPVTQIDTFSNGLTLKHRDTINAAAGGTFLKRHPEECYDLIENMAAHHNDWDTSAKRNESCNSITFSIDQEIVVLKPKMAEINKSLMKVLQINQQVKAWNNQGRNQFLQGASHDLNQPPTYQAPAYQALGYQAPLHQPLIPQSQVVTTAEFTNYMKENDAILKNMHTNMTSLTNSNLELKNMFGKFMKMNIASSSGSRSLLSNTVTNPKEDLKGITTRSGTAYQGPTIPTTSSSLPKVVEHETEVTKDTMPPTNNGSTKDVQPLVVQIETLVLNSEPVVAPIILPVVAPISALYPNPKPLIPYPSRFQDQKMTLKLADWSISRPIGVTEDVFVKVGKFYFLAEFIVVDFDTDPRVPLILGRSFLKIEKALIDVFEGELTLHVGKEAITFNLDQTSRYSANYNDMTVNQIDVIDMASKNDKSSIDEPSEVKLKDLPPHHEYAFLEGNDKLPIIISKDLSVEEKVALIKVLKSHKQALLGNSPTSRIKKKPHLSVLTERLPTVACLSGNAMHRMLKRCEDTNLCLNWEKSHFMVKEGIVVGHKISKNEIEIARLMTRLLEKDTPFFFSNECIEAFQTLQKKLTKAPILITPYWDLPFKLMCDASDVAIGAVLGQRKTKHFQLIHCTSKTMTDAQAHYTTTEKELLAVGYAFEKFWPYLIVSKNILYTDHSALKYFFNKQDAEPRLLRWVLLLHEFDINVCDKKGAKNLAADHLSRLGNPHQSVLDKNEINETFPLETLNMVSFRESTVMPTTWSNLVTLVNVRERFHNKMKCLKILSKFVKFSKFWGIDLMGSFPLSRGNKYILVTVDYLSKWVKAKALPTNDARVVCKFLKSLFTRFGTPRAIISDRGMHFCNDQFAKVMLKYGVTHRLATTYHPQTSRHVEVSNHGLKRILERTVDQNQASWSDKLDDAL